MHSVFRVRLLIEFRFIFTTTDSGIDKYSFVDWFGYKIREVYQYHQLID
jgi:hypothetical protein